MFEGKLAIILLIFNTGLAYIFDATSLPVRAATTLGLYNAMRAYVCQPLPRRLKAPRQSQYSRYYMPRYYRADAEVRFGRERGRAL